MIAATAYCHSCAWSIAHHDHYHVDTMVRLHLADTRYEHYVTKDVPSPWCYCQHHTARAARI